MASGLFGRRTNQNLLINFMGVIGGWSPQSVPRLGWLKFCAISLASVPNSDEGCSKRTTPLKEDRRNLLCKWCSQKDTDHVHQIEVLRVASGFGTRIADEALRVQPFCDSHCGVRPNSQARTSSSHQFNGIQCQWTGFHASLCRSTRFINTLATSLLNMRLRCQSSDHNLSLSVLVQ